MLVTNLATVAVLWMGGIQVQNGGLEIGNLIAFIKLSAKDYVLLNNGSFHIHRFFKG